MNKHYVRNDGRYLGAHPIMPRNAATEIPESIDESDYQYLAVSGSPGSYIVSIDTTLKISIEKTELVRSQLGALYAALVTEVLGAMELVFKTTNSDSAIATRETWKDMVFEPSAYSSEGLKSPEILRDANDVVMFGIGDFLNTDQKITDYSQRKLDQARAYGIWRIKRFDTFGDDKNTILGV